mgnify:CR=1 FL=1
MKNNEEMLKKFPTMKTQGAAKNEANNAAQAAGAAEAGTTAGDNNGFFTPNEKIDFSKVKVEPLFEEQVDFETFSKSDFRAVKVKDLRSSKKSKSFFSSLWMTEPAQTVPS